MAALRGVSFEHKKGTECTDAKFHRHCLGRWRGSVSMGFDAAGKRLRRRVTGPTKTAVLEAMADLREELGGPETVPHLDVWRAHRAGGDTKTPKSRRSLRLPDLCVEALLKQREQQDKDRLIAGTKWQENGLVFASAVGTPLLAGNVRRAFRSLTKRAGLQGQWTPRELRTSFVSLLSETGMAIEEISHLVGHSSTVVTETVYRHELRPVIRSGADAMDQLFPSSRPKSG